MTSFPGLFGEVASAYGARIAAAADPHAAHLARRDGRARQPRSAAAARSAAQRGLRARARAPCSASCRPPASTPPPSLADAASPRSRRQRHLAYESRARRPVRRLRAPAATRLGRDDEHLLAARATAALRAEPRRWSGRPVLLYGFDDLVREQIELVDGARRRPAPVTVAIASRTARRARRPSRAARALRDELGGEIVGELEPDRSHTASATLFHLERNLFDPEPATAACEDALQLLESAGERGEAELIGRRIAALIAERHRPGRDRDRGAQPRPPGAADRARARPASGSRSRPRRGCRSRSPRPAAPCCGCWRSPAARAGRRPRRLPARPGAGQPGRGRLARARVRRERMRGPPRRRSRAGEDGRRAGEIWALQRARRRRAEDPAALAGAIAGSPPTSPSARTCAHGPAALRRRRDRATRRRRDPRRDGRGRRRSARSPPAPRSSPSCSATSACRSGAARPRAGSGSSAPTGCGPAGSRDLFVAGLTDGSFPAPAGGDPLLSDERRRELGAARSRRDPAAEERYLFYSCVSRPAAPPAPELHGEPTSPAPPSPAARSSMRSAPCSTRRPTPTRPRTRSRRELTERIADRRDRRRARAGELAADPGPGRGRAAGGRGRRPAGGAGASRESAPGAAAVAAARAGLAASRKPGPLSNPAVLAELRAKQAIRRLDAGGVRELLLPLVRQPRARPAADRPPTRGAGDGRHRPRRARAPLPRGAGRIAPDGGDARGLGAGRPLASSRASAERRGWDPQSARARISLARLDAVLIRFLRRDAATGGPMQPDPTLLEAAFGDGPDDRFPPADLGNFRLHGRIDRVDVSSDGKALIRDYKLSTKVVAGAKLLPEGKLQLPLYMEAVKAMGLEPIGGVYHPLAATKEKDRPRGMIVKEHKDVARPGDTRRHVGTDFFDQDELRRDRCGRRSSGPARSSTGSAPARSAAIPATAAARAGAGWRRSAAWSAASSRSTPRKRRSRMSDEPEQLSLGVDPELTPRPAETPRPPPRARREPRAANPPCRRPPSRRQRSTRASATSSSRRAPGRARRGSSSTATATPSTSTGSSRSGSSPSPSPRRRPPRCAAGSGSS